ncbi:MAG: hypothetical protein JRI36_04775, partial [Deltaproteobacteria bacterium]|nr:hypothetical protein [Deltaproteobacteria bacterium]
MRLHNAINSPARLSISAFACLIAVGTLLLLLPAASTGDPLGLVDALFTSTSAACVTGLTVVDTGTALTRFGQLVVLGLIQAGGLGILTLSTVFLLVAGRRVSIAGRLTVRDTFTHTGERSVSRLLFDVVRFTFVIEALGAMLLFIRFFSTRGPGEALYLAVFHAISAFCNAGFSPFSDSLTAFRNDWLVNFTVCGLIILGGIGFLVLAEVKSKRPLSRVGWARISLHSKLALASALVLNVSGAVLLFAMEYHNTL